MTNEERLARIKRVIHENRHNTGITDCEILGMITEIDDMYLAAQTAVEKVREDHFHSGSTL